jgi:hypothetical protein
MHGPPWFHGLKSEQPEEVYLSLPCVIRDAGKRGRPMVSGLV